MEKFHITIKDNETGEIFLDRDTSCVVGALDEPGGTTGVFGNTHCNAIELAATATGAINAAIKTAKQLPDFALDVFKLEITKKLGELFVEDTEKEDTNDTDASEN